MPGVFDEVSDCSYKLDGGIFKDQPWQATLKYFGTVL